MNKSESIKELAIALAKFQGEVTNPTNSETVTVKTKSGASYSYKYAPLDEILKLVRPILSKNGLAIVQIPHSTGKEMCITTTLLHSSGEWIEYPPLSLMATDLSPQSAGSVITYGRRYALSAILGIASDDDNDANNVEPPTQPNSQSKPKSEQKQDEDLKTIKDNSMANDAQLKLIYKLVKEKNYSGESMSKYIKTAYNKNSSEELNRQEAIEVINMLNGIK